MALSSLMFNDDDADDEICYNLQTAVWNCYCVHCHCTFTTLPLVNSLAYLLYPSYCPSPQCHIFCICFVYVTIFMELTAQKGKATGKKGPATVLELGPTLHRGVSATRATETGRDPSSSIAPMYRSQVCRYPAMLKTCASRLVLCAM